MKAVLGIFLVFLLAVPMALPLEEYCSEGDDCCDSPCADCYYHCTCSITFSALPVTSVDLSAVTPTNNAEFSYAQAPVCPGFVLLPDLPPRHA